MVFDLGIKTGINGLDQIMFEGFIEGHQYLVVGPPGSGKTILSVKFCLAGVENGENVVYVTVEEKPGWIKKNLLSLDIDLTGISFIDATPSKGTKIWTIMPQEGISEPLQFSSIEFNIEQLKTILQEIHEKKKISRLVIDSLTSLLSFYDSEFKIRKAIISLFNFLRDLGCTTLLTLEEKSEKERNMLEYLVDGVLKLSFRGKELFLEIMKLRGHDFIKGLHTVEIKKGPGIMIYPKFSIYEHMKIGNAIKTNEPAYFGIKEIDQITGDGLQRGTLTLLSGNTGTGKTLLSIYFLINGINSGENGLLIFLEGTIQKLIRFASGFNIDLKSYIERGLTILEIDPFDINLNKLMCRLTHELGKPNVKRFVIDGFRNFELMYSDAEINNFVHVVSGLTHLNNFTGIITREIPNVTGDLRFTESGISFNFDNLILLRYSELEKEITKTISVIKMMGKPFKNKIYPYTITSKGFEFSNQISI